MSGTQINLNQVPNEPTLNDLLDLMKKQISLALSAHHVATIQSFDASKQTATATINYKKTYFEKDTVTGVYSPVSVDYPILIDCPVICLGGGLSSLTFPITAGDECLVLFNDRDIDNWFQGSSNGPVASSRLHSFADGIILVGVRSLAKVLTSYDSTRAVLKNNQALVGVGSTHIKIANNSTTLNTLLQSLITNLGDLTTAIEALTVTGVSTGGGTSGPPANIADFVLIGTALTTLGTQIAGLLE